MPRRNHNVRQLIEFVYGIDERVEDLEQNRPGEAPTRIVEQVTETATASDTVIDETRADFTLGYDDPARGYDRSQWATDSPTYGVSTYGQVTYGRPEADG